MALILPRNYHKITAVERNRISWIEPEQAERQDIRPLRIGILNICLLYTSPSPRDVEESRMPSSA